jgi:Ser/Thr protein kinase RdoA (MazF antagonist)
VASNLTSQQTEVPALAPAVLEELAETFAIGEVSSLEFLPAGLMNRNWRLQTSAGAFALKEFRDASRGNVRQNLAVAADLARRGLPVPAPHPTSNGDLVVEAAGSEWCLLPWVAGERRTGPALTVDEARELGCMLGLIHEGLRTTEALPAPTQPKSKASTAADAAANLGRFADLIAAKPAPDEFDKAVAVLLEQRLALIARFADKEPPAPRPDEASGWSHGDFQPLNVLWDGDEVVAVLDWDRVKVQYLADEVARAVAIHCENDTGGLDLDRIAAFAGGYRAETGVSGADLAAAADRLWWKRLTDC